MLNKLLNGVYSGVVVLFDVFSAEFGEVSVEFVTVEGVVAEVTVCKLLNGCFVFGTKPLPPFEATGTRGPATILLLLNG